MNAESHLLPPFVDTYSASNAICRGVLWRLAHVLAGKRERVLCRIRCDLLSADAHAPFHVHACKCITCLLRSRLTDLVVRVLTSDIINRHILQVVSPTTYCDQAKLKPSIKDASQCFVADASEGGSWVCSNVAHDCPYRQS